VAALLPLTGPNRETGQQALTGLRQAFAGDTHTLWCATPAAIRSRRPSPTRSRPTSRSWRSSARADSTAAAVAPVSERLQMPTVLLTADPLTGAYVVQVAPAAARRRLRRGGGARRVANGAHSRGALLEVLRKQAQRDGQTGALASER
jgi:hypothetical protein